MRITRRLMWFEIPKEFADTPEAKRLLDLYAEFTEICAQEHKAVTTNQYVTEPVAFEELSRRSRELHQALNDAEIAYDQATGEPKPIDLSPNVVREINQQFTASDRDEVIAKISKTLGYLRRQRVEDNRIAKYVLTLANGDKDQVITYADEAKSDFRNIIFWVENPEEASLNILEKIESFQETSEWLSMDRDPELEEAKRRLSKEYTAKRKNKPWWRFW